MFKPGQIVKFHSSIVEEDITGVIEAVDDEWVTIKDPSFKIRPCNITEVVEDIPTVGR